MTKAYRIVAKLKNNRLWAAILRQWPGVKTQIEAAHRLGIAPNDLGRLLNMTVWPYSERRGGRWWPIADRVARRLRETPEYLFDRGFYGRMPAPLAVEFDRPALEASGLLSLPPAPDDVATAAALRETVREALTALKPREAEILRRRFGLADGDVETLDAIGADFGVGKDRINQIEKQALRKLRRPLGPGRRLRDYA